MSTPSFNQRPFAKLADMIGPVEPAKVRVVDVDDVDGLVASLADQNRSHTVVVISVRSDSKATVDAQRLADRLPRDTDVVKLAGPNAAWSLTRALPDGAPDVFGGATRIYRPGPLDGPPGRHPLVMCFPDTFRDIEQAEGRIVDFVRHSRTIEVQAPPVPEEPVKRPVPRSAIVIPLPGAHLKPVPTRTEPAVVAAPDGELADLIAGNNVLRDQLTREKAERHNAERELVNLRGRVLELEAAVAELSAPARPVFDDPEKQLRHEIEQAWLTSGPETERGILRQFTVGPDLLDDLTAHIIDRARTLRVVVDVLTRRAFTMPSREVHPFRTDESGGASAHTRDDGATAYRASIKVNSPGAPRLMWWELPDGTVELARAAHHDDWRIR